MKKVPVTQKKEKLQCFRRHTIPYKKFLHISEKNPENLIIAKIIGQTRYRTLEVFLQFFVYFHNLFITYFFVNLLPLVVARAVKNCTEGGTWWSDVTVGEHTDYSQCLSGRGLQDKIDVSAEILRLYDKVCLFLAFLTDIFKEPNQRWLSISKFILLFFFT